MNQKEIKKAESQGIQAKAEDEKTLPPGYHIHADGTVHCHTHAGDGEKLEFGHSHGHAHTHTQTRQVVNRLARAIGHLESVKAMVENGRDCTEVLIQLAAVRSALTSTAKVILKDHMEHCLMDEENDAEAQLLALNEAIDKFM